MPHIVVSRDDGTELSDLDMADAIDAELAHVSGFDSRLCKYRFVRHREFTIQRGSDGRKLDRRLSVRCEIVTFEDRPYEVLAQMGMACLKGIETALIRSVCGSSEYPIAVSVAIILTPRFPYKTAIIAPQGDDS